MAEEINKFNKGDEVFKSIGDYTFTGKVVSAFQKLSGTWRYVVENGEGILHIFSEKQLILQSTANKELSKFKKGDSVLIKGHEHAGASEGIIMFASTEHYEVTIFDTEYEERATIFCKEGQLELKIVK